MTKEQKTFIANRTAELIGKGWNAATAEKRARKESCALSPAHKAAVARRLAMADARFERTGDVTAYNAV